MQNLAKIKEMFLMQQRLNDETNGLGWEDGYTKNGKLISWKRCIYMECAELIDSFAWKHWKNMVVIYSFFAKKAFDEQENPVQVLIVFL